MGDKSYELSNHLGNVLSVVSDRKTVTKDTKVFYEENDQEHLWKPFGEVQEVFVNKENQWQITTTQANTGAFLGLSLEPNKTYSVSFNYLKKNSFSPNVLFKVVDGGDNEIVIKEQILTQTTQIFTNFTPTIGAIKIYVLLQAETNEPAAEFALDNLLIYEINGTTNNDFATLFIPDVKSFTDYDPFGMLVPERFGQSVDYRYGFQGQEEDNEIKGEGNSDNFKYRMHDPRAGRFFARDPLTSVYPYLTPYQFAGNRPIDGNELEGKEWAAKSSEKTNSDGSITITTSIVIKMKVINKSSEITSPERIKAKAELIKSSIEERGKRTINYTEEGKSYTNIITTDVVLDYSPEHEDDLGVLIFEDRKSTIVGTKTINNPDGTQQILTLKSKIPGENNGYIKYFTTRLAITMDKVEVSDQDLTETGDHEIFGHAGGLNHPWQLGTIEKLYNPTLDQNGPEADRDVIFNNLMNSDENTDETLKILDNKTRQELLDGQIRVIIKNIKELSGWEYDELKPKE